MAETAAGDEIPANSEIIEVRVAELRQLFNSIDPAPFRDRDLDPKVEAFIVQWSEEVPKQRPLALLVRLDGPTGPADEGALLRDAIHQYFSQRAKATRQKLRHLFRMGRISLVIGLVAVAALSALGQVVISWTGGSGIGTMLRESLLIGGWVAMWRPLQIFLHDWWPILADAKLSDRLAAMPVRITYHGHPAS